MLLKEVLEKKGYSIVQVPAGSMVRDVLRHMVEHKVGAVIVVDKNNPVGIFTERDALRAASQEDIDLGKTAVDEFMTREMVCGLPGEKVEDAMSVMTEKRLRHLPIVEDGSIRGVVSIGDVVKAAVDIHKTEVHYLKNYIQGT